VPSFFNDFAVLFPNGKPRSLTAQRFMDDVSIELAKLNAIPA
jgi:hypothetical protein